MKKLSFKFKITLFTTLTISLVCAVTFLLMLLAGNGTAQSTAKQALTAFTEQNAHCPKYVNGIFTSGDNFIFYNEGIYCDIYSESYEYTEGQTPFALIDFTKFSNDELIKHNINDKDYYIYDKKIDFNYYTYEIDAYSGAIMNYCCESKSTESENINAPDTLFKNGISALDALNIAIFHAGTSLDNINLKACKTEFENDSVVFKIAFTVNKPVLPGIWIRGTLPEEKIVAASSPYYKGFIYITPIIILLSALSAYLISKNTLKPIFEIKKSAEEISKSGDLSKRINLANGNDEIYKLANTFNQMFEGLENSFDREKQFTSDASHELRTPLAVIKSECDFALSQYSTDEDKTEALVSINEQTDKMTDLVSALLSLTRAEWGEKKYPFERCNLSDTVMEATNTFKSKKGIVLTADIEENIFMDMNYSLISQMVQNLISNAEKYGKDKGEITVKLYSSKISSAENYGENSNKIFLSVKDNGIGIKEEDLSKIFDRFYRADSSRTGSEGFGLGLAIVKKTVELHKGKITVNSTYGEGTEFIVEFNI